MKTKDITLRGKIAGELLRDMDEAYKEYPWELRLMSSPQHQQTTFEVWVDGGPTVHEVVLQDDGTWHIKSQIHI